MMKKERLHFLILMVVIATLTGSVCRSQGRQKISLNSGWDFLLNDQNDFATVKNQIPGWEKINLPHTWNNKDVIDDTAGYHQGIGWYKKELWLSEAQRNQHLELFFEGACNKAEIYINDEKVGVHYGGFTGFRIDITPYVKKDAPNWIAVKVDNSKYLRDSVPPFSGDFNLMGGIYRDVWLVTTNPIHFSGDKGSAGIYFETPSVSASAAHFIVKGHADANETLEKVLVSYQLKDKNKVIKSGRKELSSSFFEFGETLSNPHLWSPEDPYLYQAEVQLQSVKGELLDELTIPVGFKWVGIGAHQEFLLNGKPYKLKGASRHQDYDRLGTAMTDPMHVRDIELMKEMGCNFIRIAHYPQDPAIYETCDRLGLIAWSEIPIVDRVVNNESFFSNSAYMMQEMIAQHGNHPSIAIWGFQNEVRNLDEHTVAHARMLDSIARKNDPQRLTAMAFESNLELPYFKNPLLSQILNIASINGYNVYQGWYRGSMETIGAFLDTLHQFSPSRPILLSEYGAGSSIYIHSNQPHLFDFSEEYQCLFQDRYLRAGNQRSWMIGFSIWNFIDFQRDGREDVMPNINNKGMVTTNRHKKDVYYYYKAQWSKEPFVYIAGKHWTKRYFFTSGNHTAGMQVTVYSNQKNLQLFSNGKEISLHAEGNGRFAGQATITEGRNQFLCRSVGGQYLDAMNVECILLDTTSFSRSFPGESICFNTGQSSSFFEDPVSGQQWLPDKKYSRGTWGFVGGAPYNKWPNATWNGVREGINKPISNTQNEPILQTFAEGLHSWKADVPAGRYRVSLFFCEPFTREQRKNEARIFDISLNGHNWIEQLNIEKQYGILNAISFGQEIIVKDKEGITIDFTAHSGKTLLNGVSIQKL